MFDWQLKHISLTYPGIMAFFALILHGLTEIVSLTLGSGKAGRADRAVPVHEFS